MPGVDGMLGQPPVAIRMCSARSARSPTATLCASTRRARPVDARDARVVEQLGVDAVQPRDLDVLVRDQALPLEAGRADVPAVRGGVGEVVPVVRGVDEELLRDAADVHAGAAEASLLDDRHPAPKPAESRLARVPPEPAPITTRSKSYGMRLGCRSREPRDSPWA